MYHYTVHSFVALTLITKETEEIKLGIDAYARRNNLSPGAF